MRPFFLVLIFIGLATQVSAEPIKVASLSTVLTDIARNVGGDRVEILEIIKPGSDPHLYEPTPGDIKKISSVQIVLASGLGFEPYLDKLRSSVEKKRGCIRCSGICGETDRLRGRRSSRPQPFARCGRSPLVA